MRIFKNASFSRYVRKEDIKDNELLDVIKLLKKGVFDADLGGNVFKMRVARQGKGKSGGFRVLVFFRKEERAFFAYGFAKNALANISQKELLKLKKQAKTMLAMTEAQIEMALKEGILTEIKEELT